MQLPEIAIKTEVDCSVIKKQVQLSFYLDCHFLMKQLQRFVVVITREFIARVMMDFYRDYEARVGIK